MTTSIFNDSATARFAREPILILQLHAFLAIFIHTSKANNMRCHFAIGIIAAILPLHEDARYTYMHHLRCKLWRYAALDIDKLTLSIHQLAGKIGWLHFQ